MNRWRILKLETYNPFMNMAIDEAILRARAVDLVPNTLRFYGWQPSAISVGKFQKIENEVNLDVCNQLGVEVVRRISGGGSVFHDSSGEITYSVIANTKDLGASEVTQVYSLIYSGISEALRLIGVTADYSGGNFKNCPNLTVNGKKISGSAQANTRGFVLQHGTLLLDVDLPKMFKLLKVPWSNSCMQVVDVAKNKITSVKNELGHDVNPETIVNSIAHGFKVAFNLQVVEDVQSLTYKLTPHEIDLAEKLYNEKYSTAEWNFVGKNM